MVSSANDWVITFERSGITLPCVMEGSNGKGDRTLFSDEGTFFMLLYTSTLIFPKIRYPW